MPNDPALLGYLYCAVKRNLSNITSKSRGSVIKFITKGNIADYEIAIPPIPEMNEIIKYLNQILRAIDANKRDTALLKELRDVLLPKLMSGEIDVAKVDLMQLNSHLAEYRPPCRGGLEAWCCPGSLPTCSACGWSPGNKADFEPLMPGLNQRLD